MKVGLKRLANGHDLALPHYARADVLIFAAASTTDAVNAINTAFNASGKGKATASFAASGAMTDRVRKNWFCALFMSSSIRVTWSRNLRLSTSSCD